MVASNTEIEDITNIICQWVPETYAYDMMTEIWDNCVQFSDNESLRLTVQGLVLSGGNLYSSSSDIKRSIRNLEDEL